MFLMRINKKITFNKHFARKYIRAYTTNTRRWPNVGLMLGQRRRDRPTVVQRQMVVSAHFTSKQKLPFAYKDPENPG